MSAEKDIVNHWANKKGYFTINNLKTAGNKEVGILAFDPKNMKVIHIQSNCSITGNDLDEKAVSRLIKERFEDTAISEAIKSYTKNFPFDSIEKIAIMSLIPKSRRKSIDESFRKSEIVLLQFEDILFDVFEGLDTQYHKNDVIRTMQLTKFLLLSDPQSMAKLLSENMIAGSRKDFLESILRNKDIVKEFRKTNSERLGTILKNSGIKAKELAQILGSDVLTSRTRKSFLDILVHQHDLSKAEDKTKKVRMKNMVLEKFF